MHIAEIDTRELSVTPFFKMVSVENVPQSKAKGYPVRVEREMVEVRVAGNKHYSPLFRADDFWKRDGDRVITYAERWPEQYRSFKEGVGQEADGTPLELLTPHGITAQQISLCRALKIYSIESLHALEGQQVKTLGMNGNKLKEAAGAFMATRNNGIDAAKELAELRARIAELEGASTSVPAEEASPEEIDAEIEAADAEFAGMSDADLKDEIGKLAGSKPRGTPSRDTLENSLRELRQVAAEANSEAEAA